MPEPSAFQWQVELLAVGHVRSVFSCGECSLDEYLKQYAMQNQKKNVGRTFVGRLKDRVDVKGYYTLSSASVAFKHLPRERQKGLPRYPVPVVHLGRLAVASEVQGKGLGRYLLVDALRRTQRLSLDLGICGLESYALNASAKAFYLKYGFVALADDPFHVDLSMAVIQRWPFPD